MADNSHPHEAPMVASALRAELRAQVLPRRSAGRSPGSAMKPPREAAGRSGHNAARPLHSMPGSTRTAYCRCSVSLPLTGMAALCYGSRLSPSFLFSRTPRTSLSILPNIPHNICHAFCLMGMALLFLPTPWLLAQIFQPALPAPPQSQSVSPNPDQRVRPVQTGAPDAGSVRIRAVTQEAEGPLRHLRGSALIETSEMQLK